MTARLRVFCDPTGLYSRAMVRISHALARHRPHNVEIVSSPDLADLVVLYVIGKDALTHPPTLLPHQRALVVQCCLLTTGEPNPAAWTPLWTSPTTSLVWSYYDLAALTSLNGHAPIRFYHAPLGIDPVFARPFITPARRDLVLTSGYVHGVGAEALTEVWQAARALNYTPLHIGPHEIQGAPLTQRAYKHVQPDDEQLANYYRRAAFVGALRYTEGFELTAAEALACGARPLVFDQPAMRHWYGELAQYVPECEGEALVGELKRAMLSASEVSVSERAEAVQRFDWKPVVEELWKRVEV